MSMSTPVQLLLFASDQVDVVEPNLVCLDNWLGFISSIKYSLSICLGLC
jgi:hypothetical protein